MHTPLPLYTWAACTGENRKLRDLAGISHPHREDWSGSKRPTQTVDAEYSILWNYVHHTFEYLSKREPDKIYEDPIYGCFNTGLETDRYEEIYAFFKKQSPSDKYELIGFYELSNNILDPIRGRLPEPAHYMVNPLDFVFDSTRKMDYKLSHIFERAGRLPNIVKTIDERYREEVVVSRMREAHRRLERNYRLAVPQYSPRFDEIQLLIPVCIEERAVADCALAVRKIDDVYVAKTILTMDMAYNNARLITRPDPEWLHPLKDASEVQEEDTVSGDET